MSSQDEDFVEADDGDALQDLFLSRCDNEGLMTKRAVERIPSIAQLLRDRDLLLEEFDDIWESAPKFPEVDPAGRERIDVDSFIQIYRDIDDLFEDDIDDEEQPPSIELNKNESSPSEDIDEELEIAFKNLCDGSNLITKEDLRGWDEISQLISDDMLSEKEFDVLWDRAPKSRGSQNQLDLNGFLSFNEAVDELFIFEDEGEEEEEAIRYDKEESPVPSDSFTPEREMVVGEDLPPGVIFAELADNDFLVGIDDLQRWEELVVMLDEGDLLPLELQNMFESIKKAPGTTDKLNEDGFIALYEAIDALFEDVEEDLEDEDVSRKAELLDMIESLQRNQDSLPCGLDCTEREEEEILEIVTYVESEPQNICLSKGGKIEMEDVAGSWDLIYTSSNMMKFHKGLTGLGGSVPNGKFSGLRQNLISTRYITDVEYIERIEVTPSINSFDAVVNGDWELKSSVSLFTGAPSTMLSVEPDKVMYGPTTTRADHWKSVRSMNLLDLTYLDNDMRIMRGTTSTDSIFIFMRINY